MELADYTVECLRALKKDRPEVDIHVVAYPVNPEAPFHFDFSDIGKLYNRDKFDHEKIQLFSDKLVPDLIICSGWTDRSYLKVIRTWKNKSKTVLCMDNKWLGTLKQRIACFGARLYLPKVFDYIWVPYKQHAKFAKRMGFSDKRIKLGFYTASVAKFNGYYSENWEKKSKNFPKVLVCVARYIPQKNLHFLWEAFIEVLNEGEYNWELWNLGQGEGFDARIKHAQIKHHGFVQPKDIPAIIEKTGVFVLSSLSEPWGVVVHEFAAAGFPMVVSNHVGSHAAFVKSNKNGYVFDPNDKQDLKQSLIKIMNSSSAQLMKMGDESAKLGKHFNHQTWINTCYEMLDNA